MQVVCLQAQSSSADKSVDPVATLFELSGMQTQMQQVSKAIGQGFDSAGISDFTGKDHSAQSLERIRAAMESAFNPERLSGVVMGTLSAELSASDIHTALEWHRSELGAQITQYEVARSHLTQPEDRAKFILSLQDNPPGAERTRVINELNEAWLNADTSVSMMIDMQVAVSAAMMATLPSEQRTSLSALVEIYESQREALTVHYNSETFWSMLYVYADLSTEEVTQYIEFAQSESGQRYVAAFNLALHKAMLEGSYALGVQLGAELSRDDQQLGTSVM